MSLDEILRAARERSPVGIAEAVERERTESLTRDDDNVGECRYCGYEEVRRNEYDLCCDCEDYCSECDCNPCECEERERRGNLENALSEALNYAREVVEQLEYAYSLNEDHEDATDNVRMACNYLREVDCYLGDARSYTR